MKRTLANAADLISVDSFDEQGWRSSIFSSLSQPSLTVVAKDLKDFIVSYGELYHRISVGALSRGLSLRRTVSIHELLCEENDSNLL